LAFGGLFWAVDGEPVPTSAAVKQLWDEAEALLKSGYGRSLLDLADSADA
jgi:hypothetical protein